jgi:N-acetylmuramoyl-L-alanine amidase
LIVALDPGHPPGGTTGPTGLREDSIALAVAQAAARRLEQLGAHPLLVRSDERPVSPAARLALAESAAAHVYVSIHVDAPSADQTPWEADGVLALYHHASSKGLAAAMHDAVARSLTQRKRGIRRSSLIVLRSAWFPSVLVEGTCLALPEREALLRTPDGIESYAAGIVRGLIRWTSRPHLL